MYWNCYNITPFLRAMGLNSNIRCIEISLQHVQNSGMPLLYSNIRCIEIAKQNRKKIRIVSWIVTLDVLKSDN